MRQVRAISQEKEHLHNKLMTGELQQELSALVGRKKEILSDELTDHFFGLRKALTKREEQLREQLEEAMGGVERQLKKELVIETALEERFSLW